MSSPQKVWLADPAEIYIPSAEIDDRIAEMAANVVTHYEAYRVGSVVVMTVMKGAKPFADQLINDAENLTTPDRLTFVRDSVRIQSYSGSGFSGQLQVTKQYDKDLEGKHILIVEDIVDQGRTLNFLHRQIRRERPASVHTVALLDKAAARDQNTELLFSYSAGLQIADRFVVGRGLDHDGSYRDLPYIVVCDQSGRPLLDAEPNPVEAIVS